MAEKPPGGKQESFFLPGPLPPDLTTECINRFARHGGAGGQLIFLGQIRDDEIDAGTVRGIEYTAHEGMAHAAFRSILERAAQEVSLTDVVVRHSLGYVPVGGASLLIAVATGHRPEAYHVSRFILEAIKDEVPIYGREITTDDQSQWKVNR